ncbi:hypothetical protein [Nocardioides bizhenqiangii]|uniref:Secreted protein n=1 Tax=Nocardioides bizhenqiangii TaxID=3095076 RepID=A0ABZ0ZT84_9ACTN|nr:MULTISPECIES: hypothetical protein [unclassified Nocardioides]MDZ5622868.1 hypothetical protein [Nocardioides sp. HM23]WQQ27126.1 hypothetical protein SHK19_02605 [Nocardioides sp. HM61]
MSSTEYLVWFLAMAVLIPIIVHGGTTWAHFRGQQQKSARPADTAAPHGPGRRRDEPPGMARGRSKAPPVPSSEMEDDGGVPEKQIWRWYDDGGAVGASGGETRPRPLDDGSSS